MVNSSAVIQAVVNRQLEEYLRIYPPERLAALRERMEAFWDHRSHGPVPYAVYGLAPSRMPRLPEGTCEDDRELVAQLQSIIEHGLWEDDYYPGLSPGVRQIIIPAYFGCTEESASASVQVRPVISDAADVHSLPALGFGPGTPGGAQLARMRRWRSMTHGMLPLYEADLQGPFSVASQVWGVQEFLLALYDSPAEVHSLLRRCTQAIAEYVALMEEAADGELIAYHCMPVLWYPKGKGVAVSEDLAAVVSGRTVREFIRPCLEGVAEALGGAFVHSCGSLNGVTGELNHIRGLTGLNFSSCETDLVEALESLDPSLTVVCHNSPVGRADLPMLGPLQHAALCAKAFGSRPGAGACIVVPGTGTLSPERHARPLMEIFGGDTRRSPES